MSHPLRSARGLVLLGALTGLTPLAIDAYLPGMPRMAADLRASSSTAQLTLTALLVGLALGQLLAGPLSDAVGRRRPVLVGLTVFTLASFACALAPDIRVLIVLRFVQGASGAAGVVCARAIVRDLYSGAAAARAFARLVLVMGAAPVLAPVIGAQVLRVTSWRGIFVLLGVAGAVMLTAAVVLLKETLPAGTRQPGSLRGTLGNFGVLVRDRPYVGHALASGLAYAAMFAYISGSPFVLQGIYGLSPQSYAIAFGVNAACFVTVSQVSARLVRRTGARPLLLVGCGVQCLGGAVLGVAVAAHLGLPGVLPGMLLTVAAVGLISPNAVALALADHGAIAGAASALLGLGQFVLGGIGAPLVGLAGEGSAAPMAVVISVAATGALVSAALAHPRRDVRAAEPEPAEA